LEAGQKHRELYDAKYFESRGESRRSGTIQAMDVRDSYDSAAEAYAEHLATELDHKPLDRHLLNRFAEETRGRSLVAELGCGPGQIACYLAEQGVTVLGIDLSPEMVRVATRLYPGLEFRVGDMNRLDLPDASLAGVVAFYSIVHFSPAELGPVFREMRRVLSPGGLALISFHVGDEVVHVDDLYGSPVSLDFRFHVPGTVVEALRGAQLAVLESVEREPYEGAEYPSRRCYLLARAAIAAG
jgi:SAM-dependent methyltransferase